MPKRLPNALTGLPDRRPRRANTLHHTGASTPVPKAYCQSPPLSSISKNRRSCSMKSQNDNPFGTIESAHDFVKLLTKAVCEAKRELEVSVERETVADVSRRLDALRIALYSLEKLETHMHQSSRILNDLRS